jgi:hypothetical protein
VAGAVFVTLSGSSILRLPIMPIRQFVILVGLFCICLAIIGIAWATGNELYLWMPRRWHGPPNDPPTHPILFLVFFGILAFMTWLGGNGAGYGLGVLTGDLFLSSVVGWFAFHWTPTLSQHHLSVAMLVLSIYYWKQIDYIED